MKKRKKYLYILLVSFFIFIINVNADAGYHSNYGSNGSYSSGGGFSGVEIGILGIPMFIYYFILAIITIVTSIYAFIFIKGYKKYNYKLTDIKKIFPDFKEEEFIDTINNIFINTELAYINLNYEYLKENLGNKLYLEYEKDMKILEATKHKFIKENIIVNYPKILNYKNNIFTYFIQVSEINYEIDDIENVIHGSKYGDVTFDIELTIEVQNGKYIIIDKKILNK